MGKICSTHRQIQGTSTRRGQGLGIHFSGRWQKISGAGGWLDGKGHGGQGCVGNNSHQIKLVTSDWMPPKTVNTSKYIVISDEGIVKYHTKIN